MNLSPETSIVSGNKSTLIMRPVFGEYYRLYLQDFTTLKGIKGAQFRFFDKKGAFSFSFWWFAIILIFSKMRRWQVPVCNGNLYSGVLRWQILF
jgi:hypothetical protein